MKAAFPVWDGRIAPVFDVARKALIVERKAGSAPREREELMPAEPPSAKADRLRELGVAVLICGAISRPLQSEVESRGIQVVPFVTGGQSEIVRAWTEGRLENDLYAMPGCRGRRRFRGRCHFGRGGGCVTGNNPNRRR